MKKFALQTPDNVVFHFDLAGPGRRMCAALLDVLVIFSIVAAVNIFLSRLLIPVFGVERGLHLVQAFVAVTDLAVFLGYFSLYEWKTSGQSLGKKTVGIRVIRDIGVRVNLYQVIARNLIRPLDMFPFFYLVGGLTCFVHPLQKRLGDIVAGTVVVVERAPVLPGKVAEITSKHNSLRDDPELVQRIRNTIGAREKEWLIQTCTRRDELDDKAKLGLFKEAAAYFRARLHIEQADTLSDERLLLNIAGILITTSTISI